MLEQLAIEEKEITVLLGKAHYSDQDYNNLTKYLLTSQKFQNRPETTKKLLEQAMIMKIVREKQGALANSPEDIRI